MQRVCRKCACLCDGFTNVKFLLALFFGALGENAVTLRGENAPGQKQIECSSIVDKYRRGYGGPIENRV